MLHDRHAFRDVIGLDVERRRQTDRRAARGEDDEAGLEAGGLDFAELLAKFGHELAAKQQAHAAHVGEDVQLVVQLLQGGLEEFAARFHLFKELGLGNLGEHGFANGAGEGVAAEGGAVRARLEVLGDLFRRKDATDGDAAREALGGGDDVGAHADLFIGKERAGAATARLHFVQDEKGVVLVAELAHALGERRIHGKHAAFALHGFEDHGAGLLGNLLFKSGDVVEGEMRDRARTRTEARGVLVLPAHAHREEGAAVEAVCEGDDLVLLFAEVVKGCAARELQGGFVRFCAGIREEDAVKARERGEVLGKRKRRVVREDVAHVAEAGALLLEGLANGLRGVAEAVHGDAAAKVQIGAAFGVPEAALLAVGEHDLRRVVAGNHDVVIIGASNKHFLSFS